MSLGSGVVFGLLLAYGATRTSANRSDFSILLGNHQLSNSEILESTSISAYSISVVSVVDSLQ